MRDLAVSASSRQGSHVDSLNNDPDRVGFSLLAARAAAAGRRVQAGGTLDKMDKSVLRALETVFSSSAEAVRFFESHGSQGHAPSEALAAQVDVTIECLKSTDVVTPTNQEAVADGLKQTAAFIRKFREHPGAEQSALIEQLFSALQRSVETSVASPGERLESF